MYKAEEGQGWVPHRAGPSALSYERRRERQTHEGEPESQPRSTTAFWGSLSHTHTGLLKPLRRRGPRLGHVAVGVGWGQVKHTDARSKERSRRAD